MKTYTLTLYTKNLNELIQSKDFEECTNRDIAMERVKILMMRQGLFLSNYKYTLKLKKDVTNK